MKVKRLTDNVQEKARKEEIEALNSIFKMSAVIENKPIVRGRGRGRGWVGKFKPQPCNLRKEDIVLVDIPQSFEDAERPPLNTQTSVEDLSNKIARGILLTQNSSDSNTNIPVIDLTTDSENSSDFSSANTSIAESWIESVESLEIKDAPADEKKVENIDNNPTLVVSDEKSAQIVQDEKITEINQKSNIVLDEKPVENIDKTETSFSEVLLNAVHAQEFIPTWFSPEVCSSEYEYTPYEEKFDQSFSEDEIVLNVLNDIILALQENPGDFDSCIEHLTEHLVNFVTQEGTLKRVVDTIIQQAIDRPNFGFIAGRISQHLDEEKTLELENGVTFRTIFFKRCQEVFKSAKELCKDAESCKTNKDQIFRTCILFGELLCTMKIKGNVNKVYKIAVSQFIDIFLNIGIEENVLTLTKLLKLVGPELDKNRPKDIEALFDKVKDFYLDGSRSGHLPIHVKKALWDVYKLHSRDWDRSTSPTSPVEKEVFQLPETSASKKFERQNSNRSARSSSPVDWEEFYGGDDADLYKNYMDLSSPDRKLISRLAYDERGQYWFRRNSAGDDEFDAYEEFLKISGQLDE